MNVDDDISYVGEVIGAVSHQCKGSSLFLLEEIGVFPAVLPPTNERIVSSAIKKVSRHLGLASWVLNPLYVACKRRLAHNHADIDAANTMLLVCPDFLTAWNVRKEVFTPGLFTEELHFSMLVLTREPKSAETWAHRFWALRTVGLGRMSVQAELRVTWMAASRAFSNYYATVHRLRILHMFDTETLSHELQTSRKWLRTHVGDSSGWSYHRLLLHALLDMDSSEKQKESKWFLQMHSYYTSTHQNIIIHNRWLSDLQFSPVGQQ